MNESDIEKTLEFIETAKVAAFKNLLTKISNGETLAAHEQKLLADMEASFKARQSGTGNRIVLKQKDVAEYLGRSTRTVSYYKNKGMPVNPDGSYDLDAIDTWIEERNNKGVGQPHGEPVDEGEVGGKHHWDTFYREFRGKREELLYKQLKGELISKSLVDNLLETRAVEFKRALLERGRRLGLRLAHKDSKECQKILEEDSMFILETYSRGHSLGDMKNGEE